MAAAQNSKPDVGDILLVIRKFGPWRDQRLETKKAQRVATCGQLKLTAELTDADDFQARSSDELTLAKGDRVELLERDDEFGDGWFLGKHMVSGNTGLFPEGTFFFRRPFLLVFLSRLTYSLL